MHLQIWRAEIMMLPIIKYLLFTVEYTCLSAPAHHVLVFMKYGFGRRHCFLQATAVRDKLKLEV